MTSFPIGFWNYVPVKDMDAASVKDWEDAGMTIALSPNYGPELADIARMRSILDACAQRHIRLILCDRRTSWRQLTMLGEEPYRRDFLDAVTTFGHHPAVIGFHVGDEPAREDFPDACKAMRIQKEIAPHLSPFCNLLPWVPGCNERVGFADWSEYLDAYVREAKPDFLCYDCYAQMNPGTEGWDFYFRNLRTYQEAAARHKIPFWTTLLSVGHFRYRCPNEDDLRWQLNTALAHGAAGILYFFLYMRLPHDNYRVAPIDEHGERTQTFAWLSRVNRTFLKSSASVFRDLTLLRVSHIGRAWGDVPLLDRIGRIRRASASTPLILSEFVHASGAEYVAIVNNSQTESSQATLTVHGKSPALWRVGWEGHEEPLTRGDGWRARQDSDSCTVFPWLAPGQMELYRIQEP